MKKRFLPLLLSLTLALSLLPAHALEETPLRFGEGPELSALITLNGAVVSGPLTAEEAPGAWYWWHDPINDLTWLQWEVPEERLEWAATMAWVPSVLTFDGVDIPGNLAYVNNEYGVTAPALRFCPDVSDDRVKTMVANRARFSDGTGFEDVGYHDWFTPYVQVCVEQGLMNGTGEGRFSPDKVLTLAEAMTLAARVGATLRGETIPAAQPGEGWYQPYVDYLKAIATSDSASATCRNLADSLPWNDLDRLATRDLFLYFLFISIDGYQENFAVINQIQSLPDVESDGIILPFYNWGILTGVDQYGTFFPGKTLSRAECAAMISRIAKLELRLSFTPADYSPFIASHLTPDTVMFDTGVTAEEFLTWVNTRIFQAEEAALRVGYAFNWHHRGTDTDGKTTLESVTNQVLKDLAVTADQGTQAYKDFDYQVYYSRLIDVTGKTLEPDYGVGVGA